MKLRWLIILFTIIMLISIYGYYDLINKNGGVTGLSISEKLDNNQETIYETNLAPEIYFTKTTNITLLLLKIIHNSTEIKCALYQVTEKSIVDALKEKNALVAVEDDNYKNEFHTAQSSGAMHNKFCIFDNKTIITGATNLNPEGIYKNNNNFVIIHSKYIAQNYLDEFEEIYNDKFGQGNKVKYPLLILNNHTLIENYFCPEDMCQKQVLSKISEAKSSIHFMTFSFTDKKIADALIDKNNKGIIVKGVFEKQRWNNNYEVFKYLNESNITMIPDNNKYVMHHKTFIIDNETVITGSYNPTMSGDKTNDENIIIIKDKEIAQMFMKEFERMTI